MALNEQLIQDLQEAMRSRDTLRTSVLRFLRAGLHNEEIARGRALSDQEALDVVARQAQQRQESIEQFRRGNRPDLVAQEEAELAILKEYLPPQLTHQELEELARQAIREVDAWGPADKGRVMGRLMPQVRGRADGAAVSQLVTELLSQRGD
ncbi:MAG: GatB/YqeY domain-containing protein [Dehalococcoidia bacterium]